MAGGAYDPSVMTEMPAWREVRMLIARELREPVDNARPSSTDFRRPAVPDGNDSEQPRTAAA